MPLRKEGGSIEYELYIDVFVLVNFMMDYVILSFSKKVLRCPATRRTICLGALTGAVLTSFIVVIPIPYRFVKFILFHGLTNFVMIKTGLRINGKTLIIKAYIVMYICSFLIGGIFTSTAQYLRGSGLFFLTAFLSYSLAVKVWDYISKMKRCEKEECIVLLRNGENEIKVKALIDTGNRLKDSLTGKPVSIISKEIVMELGRDIAAKDIRYIPYHTIGRKEGVMPIFSPDYMCLYLEEEIWIEKPLVAVSEESFCESECRMILNPDVK